MFYWRPQPPPDESGHLGSFLAGCLAGLIVGAAMGVLTAPHRGDVTRRKLARRVEETRDQVVAAVEDLLDERLGRKPPAEDRTDN